MSRQRLPPKYVLARTFLISPQITQLGLPFPVKSNIVGTHPRTWNKPHSIGRRQIMSYSISTLMTRNLSDVFGENDAARRRAAIEEIFTEDCAFYEPKGVYRG